MKILCNSCVYDIDNRFVQASPYLNTLLNTGIGVDKVNDSYVLDDILLIEKYVRFIQGEDFSIADKEKEEFLSMCDFFGHKVDKYHMYESHMIPMKMHDDWVRDNLYRLNLLKDPFYDLVEIPIDKEHVDKILNEPYIHPKVNNDADNNHYEIPTVRKNMKKILENKSPVNNVYIAGGVAMYLAGWTNQYKDIDLFFTSKDALEEIILKELNHPKKIVREYMDSEGDVSDRELLVTKNSISINYGLQGILRLYKAPTEIVHGFDVDCCGILYDPCTGKLWATKRALWSYENKMNIFDPERASPSYVYRLSKYQCRGFDIYVPLFSSLQINEDIVEQWKDSIRMTYMKHLHNHGFIQIEGGLEENTDDLHTSYDEEGVKLVHLPEKYYVMFPEKYKGKISTINDILDELKQIDLTYPWGQMIAYMGDIYNKKEKDIDRLFLAKVLHVYNNQRIVSDYDPNLIEGFNQIRNEEIPEENILKYIILHNGILYLPDLEWKEQNPMDQVTSTFNPQPIEDMKQWLRESRFLH